MFRPLNLLLASIGILENVTIVFNTIKDNVSVEV